MKDGGSTFEDLSRSGEIIWEQQEMEGAGAVAGAGLSCASWATSPWDDQDEAPHVLSSPPVTAQDGGEQL